MNSPADDSPTDNGSSTDNSQEAHVLSAVEAVCAHTLSFHDAAKQFDIPATTITNCLKGGKAPSIAHESQQLLSSEQQKVVIEWLRWHGDNGNLMTCEQLAALIFDLTEWSVTSRNTLDCADSSRAVHVTFHTRHCLPAAPSHLGPVPRAWNLSPWFVSLFGPLSLCPLPFAFVSLCDLTIHDSVSIMSIYSPIPIRFRLDT